MLPVTSFLFVFDVAMAILKNEVANNGNILCNNV